MMFANKNNGFSLVETLVAVTILLIVIVGPLAITSSTARSTSFASEQVTAFFLAQEGLEIVQKVRDDLFLEYIDGTRSDPWGDFLASNGSVDLGECFSADGCGLIIQDTGIVSNSIDCGSADCSLYLDEGPASTVRSIYSHDNSDSPTGYTREIFINDLGNGRELQVVSIVTWRSGNIRDDQTVRLETYLLNTYAN